MEPTPSTDLRDANGIIVRHFPRAVSGEELVAALSDLQAVPAAAQARED